MPELLIVLAAIAGLVAIVWVVELVLARRARRRLEAAQQGTGHHPQHNNPLVDEAHGYARVIENNQQMGGF
jgi:hypothetical protein